MKTYTDGRNPGVQECRAKPSRPSVTNPSSVTDGRSEFIDRLTQFLLVFLSLGQSKSGSPGVPGPVVCL
jgi:hypothetical protein